MDNTWNENEFLAFCLLYAAHSDAEYTEEEKEAIKNQVDGKTYEKIHSQFMDLSDYETLQTILSYKGLYYPTAQRREELISKIKALFHADGDFSRLEKTLLRFLERLM